MSRTLFDTENAAESNELGGQLVPLNYHHRPSLNSNSFKDGFRWKSLLRDTGAGKSCQCVVRRKVEAGESQASIASETMPFIQYDIHRQLMYKLRIYGLNAVFGLKIQFSVGESLIVAVATGTALLDSKEKLSLRRVNGSTSRRDTLGKFSTEEVEAVRMNSSKSETPLPPLADSDSDDSTDSDCEPDGSSRQRGVVVQIDDEQDEDLVLLLDPSFRDDFQLRNVESYNTGPGSNQLGTIQMVNMVKQGYINLKVHHPNRQLAALFKSTYQELQAQLWYLGPCVVVGLDHTIQLLKADEVQIRLTASVLGKVSSLDDIANGDLRGNDIPENELNSILEQSLGKDGSPSVLNPSGVGSTTRQMTMMSLGTNVTDDVASVSSAGDVMFPIDDEEPDEAVRAGGTTPVPATPIIPVVSDTGTPAEPATDTGETQSTCQVQYQPIEITPLSFLHHTKVERFLGRLSLHFVKEASVAFEPGSPSGGMGGFTHAFLTELHSLVRAHTAALGGNALLSFSVDQSFFSESIKNQGYSLLSVSGDVVEVTHFVRKTDMAFTKSNGV
ncbi:hypothetical protein BC829DRAFT_415211 [Chytridium lagenaria]|nr:hypothetical protein BC829DRAFT_415211 [Chytridium lagenaria]